MLYLPVSDYKMRVYHSKLLHICKSGLHISSIYKMEIPIQYSSRNLDPSYKIPVDLDIWDCYGKDESPIL